MFCKSAIVRLSLIRCRYGKPSVITLEKKACLLPRPTTHKNFGTGCRMALNLSFEGNVKRCTSIANNHMSSKTCIGLMQWSLGSRFTIPGCEGRPALSMSICTSSTYGKTFSSNKNPGKKRNSSGPELTNESRPRRHQDGSPQILLIESEDNVMNVTLGQAERIAKRRELKLVQVEDPNLKGTANKQVFKLVTGKEYYEISRQAKAAKSPTAKEKSISFNGKIAENDLKSKLANIVKWVKKGSQIKVTIASRNSSPEDMEKVYAEIEQEVKSLNGQILQHREKFGDVKFYIAPPKKDKKQSKEPVADESSSESSGNEKQKDVE